MKKKPTNHLPNLSKRKDNESPQNTEPEFVTNNGLFQVFQEFNANDMNINGTSSHFYTKKNTKHNIFSTLKRSFIPPGEIIEEIKQKYDFHVRLKEINKRGNFSTIRTSYTIGHESTSPNAFNRNSLNHSSLNRGSGYSTSPKHFNRVFANLNANKASNKPAYMRFQENVVGASTDNQVKMSMNSTENECKTFESKSNCTTLNKTRCPVRLTFYDKMKLTEMNSLLSNSKYPLENIAMQNIVKAFIATFPEKFEQNKHYFKTNTSIINSDNKQIQMFLVCLDVIADTIDELITDDQNEENCLKCMTLLDSIYVDFCRHTSQNSNYRSEFLKKIWIKRIDIIDVLFALLKSNVAVQSKKIDSLLEENEKLTSLLKKNEEEKDVLRISLKVKSRENEKWMEMMIEKDKKEKEMKDKIEELTKLNDEKSRAYEEISTKFHARLNPFIRKNLFGDVLSKFERGSGSGSKENEGKMMMRNNKLLMTETNKKKNSMLCDTTESNANIASHVNLDLKDIIKSRKSRGIIQSKNLKERISENKECANSRKQIHNNTIFSMDNEIKQEIINTLTSKKQFELYMNKGINFQGDIVKEKGTQTDIEGRHIDEVVDNDIMNTLKTSLQQMSFNFEAMQEMLNSGKGVDEMKEMFNIIQEKNYLLNEELYKIIEESDIVYKDNENLRTKVEQLRDQEDQTKEIYLEVFAIFSDALKDNNSDIVKFVNNHSEKIKSLPFGEEIKEIFTSLTQRNREAVEKGSKGSIYQYIPKPELDRLPSGSERDDDEDDDDEPNNSKSFRGYKMRGQSEKKFSSSLSSKKVLAEFRENFGKIKVQISLKQTIKIINSIYFEWVEKVYFKTNKVNFDKDDHFIEFGELPLIYFLNCFRLENLAKKKLLEFFQALTQYESSSKRISLFMKLIQIRKKPEDASSVAALNTFRRRSIKSTTGIPNMTAFINSLHGPTGKTAHRGSICINDESKLCFDVFVSRQLLLFIQYANVNKLLIKSNDENNLSLYLHVNKLYDMLLQVYKRLPLTSEMKKKFSLFLEKGKRPLSKNMKTFYVVDFDELLDCISEVIIELKMVYSKILKTIFNSIDSDGKQKITLFEFLILLQYVFPQKYSYDHIESIFNAFCVVKHQGDLLPYEMFETVAIESDFLDMGYFYAYLRINTGMEMTVILKYLQDELKSSAVCVLDHIMKRLNAIQVQSNPFHALIAGKVQTLKTKIVTSNIDNQDEGTSIWLSFRLVDDLSLELYNEYKFSKLFQELNTVYQELKPAICDQISEPYIFTYIKKLDADIHDNKEKLNLPIIDIELR